MEARVLICCLAVAFAASTGFLLYRSLRATVARRKAVLLQEDGSSLVRRLVGWYLRNGISFLMPVARVALRVSRVRKTVHEAALMVKGRWGAVSERAMMSVFLLACLVAALVTGVVSRSILGACAVVACVVVGSAMAVTAAIEKRKEHIQAEVPVAIESLAACFGAGYTLLQTLEQVSRDISGPLSGTFERAARVLELGGTAEQALDVLHRDTDSAELAFLAVALDVQHQSGGSLRHVLDAVASAAKGELELKRSLRVQTAQAKLSARIVAIMPLILVTAFSLVSPTFLQPFFSSPLGYGMLVGAIAMQVAGILLVRRALKVEVGA